MLMLSYHFLLTRLPYIGILDIEIVSLCEKQFLSLAHIHLTKLLVGIEYIITCRLSPTHS